MRKLVFCIKLFVWSAAIAIIIGFCLIYHYSEHLPNYKSLANYYPPSVTRIYSRDGTLIEEYAVERRVFVPINSLPQSLIEAFVAAEDKNFYHHSGVDITSTIRAAIASINNILQNKRVEGGSTITQQVVKNFFLTPERSIERKIKEAILSYMISNSFSKERILELYLNQLYLGYSAYGVAAAASVYFNKSVDELTLSEAAFLAGLPKAPSAFNPKKNYTRSKERRDYVIHRMLEDGYISEKSAKEALGTEIVLSNKKEEFRSISAGYYAEKVREEVIKMVGYDVFYQGGLTPPPPPPP
jgi:penicillin-binding protein 1A